VNGLIRAICELKPYNNSDNSIRIVSRSSALVVPFLYLVLDVDRRGPEQHYQIMVRWKLGAYSNQHGL